MTERELIGRLQKRLPRVSNPKYELAIGDDAAIRVGAAGERLIVTADVSVENVHFTAEAMTFEEIGYRSMVGNLSDCAAMGALPDSAIVQLVFPQNRGDINVNESIEQIYSGFAKACERWDFPIVGGDLSGGGAWTIGITLIGSIPENSRAVKRAGVRDGDVLWVTGFPGQSAAGLACIRKWGRGNVPQRYASLVSAHVAPTPRIGEGLEFARSERVRAMMDLSDGLSKDVGTLCYDNDLGFVFDPVSPPPPEMAALSDELGRDWRDWFYHGGEEYELLVVGDGEFGVEDMIRVGRFTSEHEGMFVVDDDGMVKKLPVYSWDHCAR